MAEGLRHFVASTVRFFLFFVISRFDFSVDKSGLILIEACQVTARPPPTPFYLPRCHMAGRGNGRTRTMDEYYASRTFHILVSFCIRNKTGPYLFIGIYSLRPISLKSNDNIGHICEEYSKHSYS